MTNTVLVIISGPSGVGKSEIAKRLLNCQELNIKQRIGFTTRSPRQGEVEGQEYYFVSKEEFLKRLNNKEISNYFEYNNNYYWGSPISLENDLLTKNILQIITIESFKKAKKVWGDKIVSFWLQPSHIDKLLSNLRKRGDKGDKEEDIEKRLAIAETEMSSANKEEYDHVFTVNDNLDELAEIIKKEVIFKLQELQTQVIINPRH